MKVRNGRKLTKKRKGTKEKIIKRGKRKLGVKSE